MSAPTAQCPNCGGPVRFLWSGAVQTTCPFCRSILVRRDLDLEKVGEIGGVPPVTSSLRIGARGVYERRPFTVVGRIVYEFERGTWSEWHLGFDDGGSGWLSDAQAEYAVSFLNGTHGPLPPADEFTPGQQFELAGTQLLVASITRARYRGVEGELPFEYWDRGEAVFVDLRAPDARFSTIDYSDDEPALYDGRMVEWSELMLTGLEPTGWDGTAGSGEATETRVRGVAGLNCPNCGSAITLRDPDNTVNVACGACGDVIDARSPVAHVLQKYNGKVRVKPVVPLGSRGTLHGRAWDVLGFQQRTITADGHDYSWREYMLRNPEQGYRYLTEYDGHWNDVSPLRGVPKVSGLTAEYGGETFKHFQTATARTTFVLGEFPWQVRSGDEAEAADYVHPPRMLSLEKTADEDAWSVGEYVEPARVWEAFKLPGKPPAPRGVFGNQPNPRGITARTVRRTFGVLLLALLALGMARAATARRELAMEQTWEWSPGLPEGGAVASQPFVLDGRLSNVDVTIQTDLDNRWAYFNLALIDEDDGTAKEVGREVSYYHGVDGGESWSEGSSRDHVSIPEVKPGHYFLRVAPEGDAPVRYQVRVRRDVPEWMQFLVALVLLGIPWIWMELRAYGFELARWAESDHPKTTSSEED
ncbi:MAG: hypothetical protein JWM27_2827 [Gemmatimonadetes bacterium]|nr:hypothetical protein [Gemmatimonadota bacterium]